MVSQLRSLTNEASTSFAGTAGYAAPELLNGGSTSDKADVYSLGIVLLELFGVFATEMERIQTIGRLESGIVSHELQTRFPQISQLLLETTSKDVERRPNVEGLLARCSSLCTSYRQSRVYV